MPVLLSCLLLALFLPQDSRLLLSRDSAGVSPILRAARLGQLNIVNLILTKLPQAVKTTDLVLKSGKI